MRALGVLALALCAVLLVACGPEARDTYEGVATDTTPTAQEPAEVPFPPQVRLVRRWDGFDQPLFVTHAGDGSGRVFVVEKTGRIWAVEDGEVGEEPYLDLSGSVSTNSERGLLSVAFSPAFAEDRRLWVDYTDLQGSTIVARFTEIEGVADPDTRRTVLAVGQPYANHNGGQLAFGPDGYLYIGMGDGGGAGDPEDRAQDPASLLGKMLRIDVLWRPGANERFLGTAAYVVPETNAWAASGEGAPEIWALGLRNPWRFSFDRETGDLWIGDVGQNAWEEVDFYPAGSAPELVDFGWRVYEGTHEYSDEELHHGSYYPPVHEYGHDVGSSVTGGYVYRGDDIPGLVGAYVFGDYVSGAIWALPGPRGERHTLIETDLAISSFGEDEDGELYVCDIASGSVYQLARAE